MPDPRFKALGPLPGTSALLGLALFGEARPEPVVLEWLPEPHPRELDRASKIVHPNVVRVYGLARLEQGPARAVEYVDGEPLNRILEVHGPLPPAIAARLVADAAEGLHQLQLAGADDLAPSSDEALLPETLLVSFQGRVKVAVHGALPPRESPDRRYFVAPEQVLGGRDARNVQTDVYLLGLILHAALTGKLPFEGEAELEQAVLFRPLDVSGPRIPQALEGIIARATEKKGADRYASPQALREALEASMPLPGEPEVATWLEERFPDTGGARAERRRMIDTAIARFARPSRPGAEVRPRPNPWGAGALIVTFALTAVGLVAWLRHRSPEPRAYPPELVTAAAGDAGTDAGTAPAASSPGAGRGDGG